MIEIKSLLKRIDLILESIALTSRDVLIYRLTILMLILRVMDSWIIALPVGIASIFIFLSKDLAGNRWLWLLVLLGLTIYNINSWFFIDNHKYLINYWVGVCFLSTLYTNRVKVLKINAHILIALTFLFAVFWKFASPDFLSTTFMQVQLLTESRLQFITEFFTSIEYDQLRDKIRLMDFIASDPNVYMKVTLNDDPVLEPLAIILTYSALLLEIAIVISFSFYKIPFFKNNRDHTLAAFILSTYLLVPVTTFGFILTLMGLAQLDLNYSVKFKRYFLLLIFLLLTSRFSVVDLIRSDFSL